MLVAALLCATSTAGAAETWRGLEVGPERPCRSYESSEWRYGPEVEYEIAERLGGLYGPYAGTCFGSFAETEIEHIVARREAADSGLCDVSAAIKRIFASDPGNLTLADARTNRRKGARDAGEWGPAKNRCWFAGRVIDVKRRWGLSVDERERRALEGMLHGCNGTGLKPASCGPRPVGGDATTGTIWWTPQVQGTKGAGHVHRDKLVFESQCRATVRWTLEALNARGEEVRIDDGRGTILPGSVREIRPGFEGTAHVTIHAQGGDDRLSDCMRVGRVSTGPDGSRRSQTPAPGTGREDAGEPPELGPE